MSGLDADRKGAFRAGDRSTIPMGLAGCRHWIGVARRRDTGLVGTEEGPGILDARQLILERKKTSAAGIASEVPRLNASVLLPASHQRLVFKRVLPLVLPLSALFGWWQSAKGTAKKHNRLVAPAQRGRTSMRY